MGQARRTHFANGKKPAPVSVLWLDRAWDLDRRYCAFSSKTWGFLDLGVSGFWWGISMGLKLRSQHAASPRPVEFDFLVAGGEGRGTCTPPKPASDGRHPPVRDPL